MNSILAIADHPVHDERLIAEVAAAQPERVTVLIEGDARTWAWDDTEAARAVRDRLAWLIAAVERETGAIVAGTVCRPEAAAPERYDRVVAPGLLAAA